MMRVAFCHSERSEAATADEVREATLSTSDYVIGQRTKE
jgi:hypothetical protein